MKRTFFCLLFLMMTGCMNLQLKPVTYDQVPYITSEKTAEIHLVSGEIGGDGISGTTGNGLGVSVTMSSGPNPDLFFDVKDQEIFIDSLRSELARLKILNASPSTSGAHNIDITIIFDKTHNYPNVQEYELDVTMIIKNQLNKVEKKYHISSADETSSMFLNTAPKSKFKAATKLLNKVIPDIQNWLKSN